MVFAASPLEGLPPLEPRRRLFPALHIATVGFSFAAYPLSGGFKPWSRVGHGMARHLLRIERAVEPVFGCLTAFRMMLVVEKQ
jgi:hypothetical protein